MPISNYPVKVVSKTITVEQHPDGRFLVTTHRLFKSSKGHRTFYWTNTAAEAEHLACCLVEDPHIDHNKPLPPIPCSRDGLHPQI